MSAPLPAKRGHGSPTPSIAGEPADEGPTRNYASCHGGGPGLARQGSLIARACRRLCCGPALVGWKGHGVSEAAPSVGGGAPTCPAQVVDNAKAGTETFAAQCVRGVLQAAQDLDPVGLQAQLDGAAAVLGLARCIDEIVMPATRGMRRSPAAAELDTAQQLMATEAVRTWLNHRGSFGPPPDQLPPILLTCGPRDRDMIGLESLALLLRFQRFPCRVLGARTTTFSLTIAAQAADAAGVVIMSTATRGLAHAVVALLAVDAMGIPVFFAGNAFEPEQSRRQLPGRYLGPGMAAACAQLIDTLAPPLRRRSAAVRGAAPEAG